MSVYSGLYTAQYGITPVPNTESLILGDVIELLGDPAGYVPSALPGCVGATFGLGGAADTWDLGSPQPVIDVLATLLGDGEVPLGRRASNRTMSLPVVIRAPDLNVLASARETLLAVVNQPYWTLQWTRPNGNAFTFDCFRAAPSQVTYSLEHQDALLSTVLLTFEALPYGWSSSVQTLSFSSPATGGTPPPSPVTIDSFSSVSSSTQPTWWASSTAAVVGSASARWDWSSTDQDSGPFYTHTLAATVDITGRTVLSFWLGLGSPNNYSLWHKGNVSFSFTLSDNSGHTIPAFGTTAYCYASNSGTAPTWNQITVPIPQGVALFDYTHIHAWSVHAWRFVGADGDLELDADTWLNGLTASATTGGSPASSRGTVYQLLGITGSAHTPIALTFQQPFPAGASPGVNMLTGQNTGFEGGLGTWAASVNCSVTGTAAQAHSGTNSMQMSSTAAGTMDASHSTAGAILTQGIPAIPGIIFTATAWFRAAVSARACSLGYSWYDGTGTIIGSETFGSTVTDSTSAWTQATAVTAAAPAGTAELRIRTQVAATAAASEIHYVDDVSVTAPLATFQTLIAHMPSPTAPSALVPLVQAGNGVTAPDGREYNVPAAATGVNARFNGTYTVIAANFSWNLPANPRTITVTIKQYEYPGGPSASVSVVRTVTPNTDISNGIVIIDNVSLPVRNIPPDNSSAYFSVAITDTNTSDRFMDLLFVDCEGQLVLVNVNDTNSYSTYWLDIPTATEDLGLLTGSTSDRSQAVSVMQYAIASGGPLTAEPGNNALLVYAVEGQPAIGVTYTPRYWVDDPGHP